MKFFDFEMRPTVGNADKWELVKWDESGASCFTIAFLEYNWSEQDFEFTSVGTRFIRNSAPGLLEWLKAWCDYTNTTLKLIEQYGGD